MSSVMSSRPYRPARRNGLAVAAATALVTLFASTANAGITFPNVPLQVSPNVPANILFVLDDSGSMGDNFLPDNVPTPYKRSPSLVLPGAGAIAQRSSWLNKLAYNPQVNYSPWQNSDGTFKPQANYNAVSMSTTLVTGGTTDLSGGTQVFYVLPAGQNPMDGTKFVRYEIRKSGIIFACTWNNGTDAGYDQCSGASTTLDWGDVERSHAQERQNYANWYHYHRTRSKSAKAGASIAFNGIDSNVRVGFRTIHNRNPLDIQVNNNKGVFTGTNRDLWYERLFNATANGITPLRDALNQAGLYYQNTGASGPYGPGAGSQQLACRQNFTLLTTDGYRNDNGFSGVGNADNADGAVISPDPLLLETSPYQYKAVPPYADGQSNTLADIAMHYWKRDLHTSLGNRVPYTDKNPAFWQHMVTFGVSLGAQGNLIPGSTVEEMTNGTKSWPTNIGNLTPQTIDDFWHATINGHGDFVVASSPAEFEKALKDSLAAITHDSRSNSNVAVTSYRLQDDSMAFEASFDATNWSGDLKAFEVTETGVTTDREAYEWSAGEQLSTRGHASRNIFSWNGSAGRTFSWSNLTATERLAFQDDEARFNYVRGDGSEEMKNSAGRFRERVYQGKHWVLGDISGSSPVYDKDTKTVYVGANDGMLHAFDAETGEERFAYVPGGIDYADLATLADADYTHKYFVDGQLVLAKIETTTGDERTMLFGALGRGAKPGKSPVFALDVTEPDSFAASDVKWEVSDTVVMAAAVNVLEAPIVARLNGDRIGLLLPNGYNNATNSASLVVLNAMTGSLYAINRTPGGTVTDPNGLGGLFGWDNDSNGVLDSVYAGDLHGRVWRFDLTSNSTTQWGAATSRTQLFQAFDGSTPAKRQPITGRVSVGLNPTTYERWLYFGTGRFLQGNDRDDLSVQTWYGIREPATAADAPSRSDLKAREFKMITAPGGQQFRTIKPASTTDMTGRKGWYLDLLTPPDANAEGERITGSTIFLGNVLLVASNSPNNDPCEPSMKGWINAIDPFTGGGLNKPYIDANNDGVVDDKDKVGGDPASSISLNNGYTTDPTFVGNQLLAGGKLGSVATLPSKYLGRISWRELVRNDE